MKTIYNKSEKSAKMT